MNIISLNFEEMWVLVASYVENNKHLVWFIYWQANMTNIDKIFNINIYMLDLPKYLHIFAQGEWVMNRPQDRLGIYQTWGLARMEFP